MSLANGRRIARSRGGQVLIGVGVTDDRNGPYRLVLQPDHIHQRVVLNTDDWAIDWEPDPEPERKRLLVSHDEHGVWTDDQGEQWVKRENAVVWKDAEPDEGARLLEELHARGLSPSTLITTDGITFVVGQRIGWKLKDTLKQTGGIGTITEFDPRRGLTDGLTVKVERDGKDPVWVNHEWISVWEDPE